MRRDTFLDPMADREWFKAFVHVGLLALGTATALYNAGAWSQRREWRLLMNTVLYSGFVAWECYQVAQHLQPPEEDE